MDRTLDGIGREIEHWEEELETHWDTCELCDIDEDILCPLAQRFCDIADELEDEWEALARKLDREAAAHEKVSQAARG